MPNLGPSFGLECLGTPLRGLLRPGSLGGQPLRGSPPLRPGLRTIDPKSAPDAVQTEVVDA